MTSISTVPPDDHVAKNESTVQKKQILEINSVIDKTSNHKHLSSNTTNSNPEITITNASPTSLDNVSINLNSTENDNDIDTVIESNINTEKNIQDQSQPLIHKKKYLKFRSSVNTNWIPFKKKTNTDSESLPISSENSTHDKNSKGFSLPKSSKRLPHAASSLISKRSSMTPLSNNPNTVCQDISTPNKKQITKSPLLTESLTSSVPLSPNKANHFFQLPSSPQNSKSNNVTNILEPSSPSAFKTSNHRQMLDRNASFSSSTPSDKSAIGKSLNAFKKTTKSILFSDSNSNTNSNANSNTTSSNIPFTSLESNTHYIQESYDSLDSSTDDNESDSDQSNDDIYILRRSFSYTEAERKQVISFAMNDLNKQRGDYERKSSRDTKRKSVSASLFVDEKDNESNNKPNNNNGNSNSNIHINNKPNTTNNRQRAKTMDTAENPLLDLTNSNTGLLSSIANFVKINRTVSSASITSSVKNLSIKDELPKLKNIPSKEKENPKHFLNILLNKYPITLIAEILSLKDNEMLNLTLQEYLKLYDFSNLPLDMALRQFLMLNYLPKETQQIDRLVYQFAKYYHDCHQELGYDRDTIYIFTYSLIMVHTDKFNPNNRRKMTRFEFVQNVLSAIESNSECKSATTSFNELTDLIVKELLGYYYDNITYCPLIKISANQSEKALEALKDKSIPYPYPNINFLSNTTSNSKNYDSETRKSISSATTSTVSTISIHKTASQQVIQPPPLRKKNSSFLWSTAHSYTDPYEYLISNNPQFLNELNLLSFAHDVNITSKNPFILASSKLTGDINTDTLTPNIQMLEAQLQEYVDIMDSEIDNLFLMKIWKSLTKNRIEFILKVPKRKGSYLISTKSEIFPLNESNGTEFYLTRVVKVGMIDKQESTTTTNVNKTSIPVPIPDSTDQSTMEETSSKSKNKVWKNYFCILTTIGMFFYEDVSLFRMRFCGINETDKSKMVIIEEASSKGQPNATESLNSGLNSPIPETSGFSFPYFRSDSKMDKKEKDKAKDDQMLPNFSITETLFATRKLQNIEYDDIVNNTNSSTTKLDSSSSNASPSISSGLTTPSIKENTLTQNQISSSQILSCRSSSLETNVEQTIETSSNVGKTGDIKPETLNFTFFIYGKGSKNIYMVSSLEELKSWIHSINITSVLKNIQIDPDKLDCTIIPKEWNDSTENSNKYYEIVPVKDISIEERLNHMSSDDIFSDETNSPNEKENKDYILTERHRSNTTFLSKIGPSISTFGIGTNTIYNETEKFDSTTSIREIEEANSEYLVDDSELGSPIHSSNNLKVDKHQIKDTSIRDAKENPLQSPFKEAKSKDTIKDEDMGLSTTNTAISIGSYKSLHPFQILLEHLYSVKRLALTMPLDNKTKECLMSTAKILGVKLEWLWYEKCREQVILLILRRILELKDKISSK